MNNQSTPVGELLNQAMSRATSTAIDAMDLMKAFIKQRRLRLSGPAGASMQKPTVLKCRTISLSRLQRLRSMLRKAFTLFVDSTTLTLESFSWLF